MKLTIVTFILVFGCLFTLRLIYDCINYKYGQRMKLYYLNKIELYEANRYLSGIRNETKLKQYREGYTPELVPVEMST
jgi:hypothetical protein